MLQCILTKYISQSVHKYTQQMHTCFHPQRTSHMVPINAKAQIDAFEKLGFDRTTMNYAKCSFSQMIWSDHRLLDFSGFPIQYILTWAYLPSPCYQTTKRVTVSVLLDKTPTDYVSEQATGLKRPQASHTFSFNAYTGFESNVKYLSADIHLRVP